MDMLRNSRLTGLQLHLSPCVVNSLFCLCTLNTVLRHAKMYCLNFFNFFITTTIVVMMHASSWHSLKKVFLSLIFFVCILFGDPVWKCINYIWAFLLQHSFKCKFTSLCFLLCILVYTLCFVDIMCACNCKCAHQLPFFSN